MVEFKPFNDVLFPVVLLAQGWLLANKKLKKLLSKYYAR
jgi:hypothetical protein